MSESELNPNLPTLISNAPEPRRATWWIWPVIVGMIAVNIGLFVCHSKSEDEETRKELMSLAGSGLEVLPFLPLIVLAQVGNKSPNARTYAFGYWLLFSLTAVGFTFLFTFSGAIDFASLEQLPGEKALDAIRPGGFAKAGLAFALAFAAMLLGFFTFTPTGRDIAWRFMPIEARSFTSATALATTIVLIAVCFIPLLILREPPILALIQALKDTKDADAISVDTSIRSLYYRLVWSIPVAIIAAGYPLTRNFFSSIRRLGLGGISAGQFIVSVAIANTLLAVMIGLEPRILELWRHMGWPTTDSHGLEELFKFAMSRSGAVAIGITAGISEELAFRGLLQPRIGLFLSNVLFTAVHAFQYNWDALLLVFVIGLVCGLVRKYFNTTASVIVHGTYDTLAVLLAVLQQQIN